MSHSRYMLFKNVNINVLSTDLWPPLQTIQLCSYMRGDSTPYHYSERSHAILTISGSMTFQESKQKPFSCVPGTILAIPPNVSYKWKVDEEGTTLLQCLHAPFHFLESRALAKLFGVSNRHLESFQLDEHEFLEFRRRIERDMERDASAKGSLLSADMLRIMAEAASLFKVERNFEHPALVKAICYIEEHLDRNLSLGELARHAGLGTSRLSQLFKECVGKPPLAYHAHLRARHATMLFITEGLRVCEAAERLGLEESYFRRFYKRQTGISPGSVANRKAAHDIVI